MAGPGRSVSRLRSRRLESRVPEPSLTSVRGGALGRGWWWLALAIALFVAPLAYGAKRAFPVWDDASLWFSITEHGADGVRVWHADRPLSAAISAELARAGMLWSVAGPVHFLSWVALGLVAASLWRRLFPDLTDYAIVPAALVIAPVFCQTQLILWNPIIDAQLGSLMAFAAVFLLESAKLRSGPTGVLSWVGAGALIVAGVLLSEYALVAFIGLAGALTYCVWSESGGAAGARSEEWRRWLRRLIFLGGVAAAAYLVYGRLAAASSRMIVRPEYQLKAQGLRRLIELPPRLALAVWEAAVGNLAATAGSIHLMRDTGVAFACAACGALVGYRLLRRGPVVDDVPPSSRRLAVLIGALCLGLVPVILMKVSPRSGVLSRLWLPLAPLAASLCAAAVLQAVRPELRRKVAMGVAAVAAFAIGNSVTASVRTHDEMTVLGNAVRQHLAPEGLTVALFADYRFFTLGDDVSPDPEELTARLTMSWGEEERRRFWASVSSYVYAPQALPGLEVSGSCALDDRRLSFHPGGTGLSRVGTIAKVLRIEQTASNKFVISEMR